MNQLINKYINEKNAIYWIIGIGLLCSFIIPLLRFSIMLLPGDVHYYNLRIAENYLQHGIFGLDELHNAELPITPLHLIIAILGFSFMEKTALFLPGILFFASFILFYFILDGMNVPFRIKLFSMFLLGLSPISLFASSSFLSAQFGVLFVLFGYFIFLNYSAIWSLIPFIIAMSQDIFNLVIIFILLGYHAWKTDFKNSHRLVFAVLGILAVFIHPFQIEPLPETGIFTLITDLGSIIGVGIFTILLLIIGIYNLWEEKYMHLGQYLLLAIGLILWVSLGNFAAFYLNFIFAYISAWGLEYLLESKWESALFKKFTTIVLICGLLFSFLSYANRLVTSQPDMSIKEAAEWIKNYSPKDSVILSIPSRGFWIEYFGKRLAFSTTQNSKESEINSFFYAHNVDRVIPTLKANNIRYIWIDKEMKNEIWSKEDEGLLLLFKNKEHFKKVYDEKGVQIWRII